MTARPQGGVAAFLANGGGAVTFRLLATALGAAILWLLHFEGDQLAARLDRIDSALAQVAAMAQGASAQGDVAAARLAALDAAASELRRTLDADRLRLDDHEHRISELEGARRR